MEDTAQQQMDEYVRQQQMELLRINQEQDQLRMMQELEYQNKAKTGKRGWIIFLVFVIIMVCSFFAYSASAQTLTFADRNVEQRALMKGDLDKDGKLSKAEADSLKALNLTQYRTDMMVVSTYEDLAFFPNLKRLWLGESKLETVDLSKNWNLEYVSIKSDNLKTLILAVGCAPKLAYPMHSGEIIIKRIKNPDAPGAMFFVY